MRPMVIAHHLVWTGYGWWLPNDPRGSTSRVIRNDFVAELGELHVGRRRVQPVSATIRKFYESARARLLHPLVSFSASDVRVIADAFSEVVARESYTCYACAIMPDHIHILIRKHKQPAEEMIGQLQDASRLRLRGSARIEPDHPVWGGPGWKVFLDHPDEVWRTMKYIENNPVHMGRPRQSWSFVTPYDNWPLHEGHSPNSPYVRRLRRRG